ncbi:hypothetical protein [Tabrizicola sp.]|uniref:hypothetical protein n=1 Tax=Tabrizicola sp. TaxID=2005166 RepID=UPI0035B4A306
MGSLLIGLVVATFAGVVSLLTGHSVLAALVAYSVAGQLAMFTVIGANYMMHHGA